MSNTKRISLEEIKTLREKGSLHETAEDAPTKNMPDGFWDHAELVTREIKKSVHLRVDADVLAFFKASGPGHLTRMNQVLRSYMEAKNDR